jgi:hypothetical protein
MKMKGEKIIATRFVIFQRANDDFLAEITETEDTIRRGWTPHPTDALKYETFEEAEAIAHKIVANKEHDYRLEVCELHETGDQFGVRPVAIVTPKAARHNPNLN